MEIKHLQHDVIIIGAGGAGLRAGLELANNNVDVAIISKVFPTRSHTVSAQGGITAALGNVTKDDWKWHMYDTVKGSDFIGDQAAIEFMCKNGAEAVYEVEHMGLPFSRNENGTIYQRPFGGQSQNFGKAQATRTCAAADRTGHALLHTLYQQHIKLNTKIYEEYFAIDLIKDDQGNIAGALVINMADSTLFCIHAKAVVLATGGAGQIYQSTTNALINTGDGMAMALRAGCYLQDMEMWQFHPTGIANAGVLMTEGCRGEGGFLLNSNKEAFMKNYAPNAKDLASRDVVSRAIAQEIIANRGIMHEGIACVSLQISHLGEKTILEKLPGIRDLSIQFAGVDPIYEPIPVVPTSHYVMGGVPTNINSQVLNNDSEVIKGLFAIGECACVSVHGANRLGGNSLLDLLVFGKSSGKHILENLPENYNSISSSYLSKVTEEYKNLTKGEESFNVTKAKLKEQMQENFGVYKNETDMTKGLKNLNNLPKKYKLLDKSDIFNFELIQLLETRNLLEVAKATAHSALFRQESRGAHARKDYPKRDDSNWVCHSMVDKKGNTLKRKLANNTKVQKPFILQERVY